MGSNNDTSARRYSGAHVGMGNAATVFKHGGLRQAMVLSSSRERHCYICGHTTSFSVIVEPLLLPVCLQPACKRRAEQLASEHCHARLSDGRICGAPLVRMSVDGRSMCARHAHKQLAQRRAAAVPQPFNPWTHTTEDAA